MTRTIGITRRTLPRRFARVALGTALTFFIPVSAPRAQSDAPDDEAIALTYHKVSGTTLDVRAAAEQSDVVRRATTFDRPDVVKSEMTRLQQAISAADSTREFVLRINDNISDYDHDRGEFSIMLFRPGYYVPIRAFGQEYQIAFSNAERARAIAMPKEQARAFDTQLNAFSRSVTNEIHFRITGSGDPSGGVTGARVIRAEIVSDRLLDRNGNVVYTPSLAASAASAPGQNAAERPFDLASADVSGFRVGIDVGDLETTLQRLFGPTTRVPAGRSTFQGYAGSVELNGTGCYSIPGRNKNPGPGAVCVTAFYDRKDVVRSIRIERVFSYVDADVFRAAMVQKYGAVAVAKQGGDFALGWGPDLPLGMVYDQSGPHSALTAHYITNDDYMSRGLNSLPQIRVVLQLADAAWAATQTQ